MDEGVNDFTKEEISNIKLPIEGHKSYWIDGVSGTALKFDGYFSGIKFGNSIPEPAKTKN